MLANLNVRWLRLTIIVDMSLTVLALLLARWIRDYLPKGQYLSEDFVLALLDEPLYFTPLSLIPLVILIWLVVFSAQSVYSTKFNLAHYDQLYPIFLAVTASILVFAGVAYFFFRDLSRFLFLYFYALDLAFLIGWRKVIFHNLKKQSLRIWQPRHRVLIIGSGQRAQDIVAAVESFAWSGLELRGVIADDPNSLAPIQELPQRITDLQVDEVVFALAPDKRSLLQTLVLQLQPLSVNLRLVPDAVDFVFARATIEDFAGVPLIGLREPGLAPFDRLTKRVFDIIVAAFLLILTLPLSSVIIMLIKLSDGGSVFYTASRLGEGGRLFSMVKFRTMVPGAEQSEIQLLLASDSKLGLAKTPDDPRITRVGRWLRRASLDELPQLINVLKGDMSLVGPRPELPWLLEHYEAWQYQRFAVPQGMTGWWQVKNRNRQQAYDIRVEDDLYYIHNYSFLLDLRILWLTMGVLIRGDGAY